MLIPVVFVVLALLERFVPARPLPRVRGWRWQGVLFFLLAGVLTGPLPALYAGWLRAHRLADLEGLGTAGGAALGFLVVEFFIYGWHRLRHENGFLWRLHQLHHAAERVDVYGTSFTHPVELVATNLLAALVTTVLLGLSPPAATLVGVLVTSCNLFEHANLRTPRWLGYLVQRPEAHSVHHARGLHAGNYADLPLWDMVFGTFVNPARFEAEAGFYDGASRRLGRLLAGAYLTAPTVKPAMNRSRNRL